MELTITLSDTEQDMLMMLCKTVLEDPTNFYAGELQIAQTLLEKLKEHKNSNKGTDGISTKKFKESLGVLEEPFFKVMEDCHKEQR